jgi:hypothetical protein
MNPCRIVVPERGILREESAVSPPAASRFLADKPGFGMKRWSFTCDENLENLTD